jgi:hypothetical protein
MIDTLAAQLDEFPGPANRARCFTHILNLVVKSIMHQFDVSSERSGFVNEESRELLKLAGDFETEELETQDDLEDTQQEQDGDGPHNDNDEDWIDEREDMTKENVEELEDRVRPIRFLLTKVSK